MAIVFDTKPNLDDCKFEQSTGQILSLCGCTQILGTLDVHPTGSIDSCSGYKISGTTMFRTSNQTISSIYIGCQVGSNGSGNNNTGIGQQALCNITCGNNNFGVGYQTLYNNTCGTDNIAIGPSALYNNTTRNCNIALGNSSLYANTGGTGNVAIGLNTLCSNTRGCYNIALGYQASFGNLRGNCNVALGLQAMYNSTCGNDNIALGQTALYYNTTGSNNIGLGNQALYYNACGGGNVAIGTNAGRCVCNGSNNVFIGKCSGYNETGSNKLYIANCADCNLIYGNFTGNTVTLPTLMLCNTPSTGAGTDGVLTWNSTDCTLKQITVACIVGSSISSANNGLTKSGANVRLGGALTGNTTITGAYTLNLCTNAKLNTQCGYQISGVTMFRTSMTALSSIYLGCNAGSNGSGSDNFGVGAGALCSNVFGNNNFGVGLCALCGNLCGQNNFGVGYQALSCNTNKCNNTAIGYQALLANTGGSNIAIGYQAMYNNTSGCDNIGFGYQSLLNNTTGSNNIALGCSALMSNTGGTSNIALGCNALYKNCSGSNNVAQGFKSLYCNTIGSCNIGFGTCSLYCNTTGNYNLGIGLFAGYSSRGSSNIFIGKCAGYNETSNGKLYIASGASTNLIYGNFATGDVTIGNCTCGTMFMINKAPAAQTLYNFSYANNDDSVFTFTSVNGLLYTNFVNWDATVGLKRDRIISFYLTDGSTTINDTYVRVLGVTGGTVQLSKPYNFSYVAGGYANLTITIAAYAMNICTNTMYGYNSLYCNGVGEYNVAVGTYALSGNTSGCNSVAIGNSAGFKNSIGSGNVFIGSCAGYNELASNRLYIANTTSCTLIYGDFTGNTVTLPTVKICNTPAKGASSDGILMWNSTDKCVKQVTAACIVSSTTTLCTYCITGNGSATGFTVAHNLNVQYPMVQIIKDSSPYATVYTDTSRPNVNCVCVMFDTAPLNGQAYRVLVGK